jgi:putative DNA-invertase from lambdoid prophage Rac
MQFCNEAVMTIELQKKRRAFGYVRVSSTRQVNEGESLAVQSELIKAICVVEGLELVEIFVEEGVSGSKPLHERREGARLLSVVGRDDVVVALKLDRMFRNVADAVTALASLKKRGVGLFLKDVGGFVSGDSVGELVFSLLSSVAAFERQRTKERVGEVKAALARQGRYMGGDVPFGCRLTERDGERFVVSDEAVVTRVRDLRNKEYSSRMIAGDFAQRGIAVSHHAVARMVRRLAA